VLGAGDRLIPPADGVRLAGVASGPTDFVVYEEGNHLGFNIPYGGAAMLAAKECTTKHQSGFRWI